MISGRGSQDAAPFPKNNEQRTFHRIQEVISVKAFGSKERSHNTKCFSLIVSTLSLFPSPPKRRERDHGFAGRGFPPSVEKCVLKMYAGAGLYWLGMVVY